MCRHITPCIPSKKNRRVQIEQDAILYKKRHKIENTFGRLKDWRRVAMRFDRRAHIFLSACALAAIVMFWLWVLSLGFGAWFPFRGKATGWMISSLDLLRQPGLFIHKQPL